MTDDGHPKRKECSAVTWLLLMFNFYLFHQLLLMLQRDMGYFLSRRDSSNFDNFSSCYTRVWNQMDKNQFQRWHANSLCLSCYSLNTSQAIQFTFQSILLFFLVWKSLASNACSFNCLTVIMTLIDDKLPPSREFADIIMFSNMFETLDPFGFPWRPK